MANETTSTSAIELIPAEYIPTYVMHLQRPLTVGKMLAWRVAGTVGVPYKFPTLEAVAVPAGTKTEVADFTRSAMTFAETSITPAFIGEELALTDEAVKGAAASRIGLSQVIIEDRVAALENRIDQDLLAVSKSATNTVGAVTDVMTETKLLAGLHLYRTLEPNGTTMVVLGHLAAADLKSSFFTSGATAINQQSFAKGALSGSYLGSLYGAEIWQSGNVAAETTGKSNFITGMGAPGSGIGFVVDEDIGAEYNRGAEGARSALSFVVLRACYGVGITRADKIVEVLSN